MIEVIAPLLQTAFVHYHQRSNRYETQPKGTFALTAAALGALMINGSALAAPNESGFSALEGVAAQTLSAEEQQSIAGALNAYTIAAQLKAGGQTQLANYFLANATQLNALFVKLHVYTPK